MIKAIIFDFDNCLISAREVGETLFDPAFEAIRQANRGILSEAALRAAFADCWRCPLDVVAAAHHFSPEMLAVGWEFFSRTEFTGRLHGYDDLGTLAELPVLRFLVTSGFCRLQQSKIDAVHAGHLFVSTHIDATDDPRRKGKQGIFAEILAAHQLQPGEVLVVGDNPDSEIAAGNRLGMPTVQILRPGVLRGDNARYYIHTLAELKPLLGHRAEGSPDA